MNFQVTPDLESSPETASYDLSVAAESSVPLNGLRVTAAPRESPETTTSTFIVRVGAADLVWKPADDGTSMASVYIMAASMDAKNKMIGHVTQAMKATAKSGTDLHAASHFADFIVVAPTNSKAKSLRFVVRDSASGKMGSADVSLTGAGISAPGVIGINPK